MRDPLKESRMMKRAVQREMERLGLDGAKRLFVSKCLECPLLKHCGFDGKAADGIPVTCRLRKAPLLLGLKL
jgi:hypothetical protein